MARCDVCGKASLLSETLGTSNLCKVCFMKINGPLWKAKSYEKHDDAEKKRQKALENAKKQNVPQSVIDGINAFFDAHEESMTACDACGAVQQTLESIDKVNLCKKCYAKIKAASWKQWEYDSNEDVEDKRAEVLKIAAKHEFPSQVIEGLNRHFDSKIQKDLIRIFESDSGQALKVYETHCILATEYEVFDIEEMAKAYGAVLRKQKIGGFLSRGSAESIVRGFLTGGAVKAGKSLATSVAMSAVTDYIAPSKAVFRKTPAKFKIYYHDFDRLDYQPPGEKTIGYFRFYNSTCQGRPEEDVLFFFRYDSDFVMPDLHSAICQKMQEAHAAPVADHPISHTPVQAVSVADEILKFKNLLDLGAITQEEYDAKKKELLKL